MSSKSYIQIVDANDNLIGHKERGTLGDGDIYRVSALWLTNEHGEVLIAQRKWTKKHDPGKWGPAAAGTVEQGETYESNMIKEAGEELGLSDLVLSPGAKWFVDDGSFKYFCQGFRATSNKPASEIIVQDEEVEQVKWVSKELLRRDIQDNPETYVPSAQRWLGVLL